MNLNDRAQRHPHVENRDGPDCLKLETRNSNSELGDRRDVPYCWRLLGHIRLGNVPSVPGFGFRFSRVRCLLPGRDVKKHQFHRGVLIGNYLRFDQPARHIIGEPLFHFHLTQGGTTVTTIKRFPLDLNTLVA